MIKILQKIAVAALLIALVFNFTSCSTQFVLSDGNDLNLDGYELVFCDEFDGDTLDTSVWEYRNLGQLRRHGSTLNEIKYMDSFNHAGQVSVEDGHLLIKGSYTTSDYGEGWHTASIRIKEFYTRGYFEIRCIPNDSEDFWSAFWLQSPSSYDHETSKGGVGGAEIDVFETYKNHDITTKNFVTSTIHCNGSDELPNNVDSHRVSKTYIKGLHSGYTTFGVMWTEEEYIFYVNGQETGRTSFANGTSCVPEEVIISLCAPETIDLDKDVTTQFIVDYVKIYQLSE